MTVSHGRYTTPPSSVYQPYSNWDSYLALYDAGDVRCWAGVGGNLVTSLSSWWDGWYNSTGIATKYTSNRGEGVYVRFDNAGYGGPASEPGGVAYYKSNSIACSENTSYTITAYIRYMGDDPPHPNLFFIKMYRSDGTPIAESGHFSVSNMMSVGNDWYLAWATVTMLPGTVSFTIQGYEYDPKQIWVEGLQVKRSGLSSSRADISRSNNVTIPSLTLSNNSGLVSYNPQSFSISLRKDDYYTPNHVNLEYYDQGYTVIAATRYRDYGSTPSAYSRIITTNENEGNWLLGHHGATTENFYAAGWVTSGSDGPLDTNWRVYTATWHPKDNVTRFYVNGVLKATSSSEQSKPLLLGINYWSTQRSDCEFGFLQLSSTLLPMNYIQDVTRSLMSRYGLS